MTSAKPLHRGGRLKLTGPPLDLYIYINIGPWVYLHSTYNQFHTYSTPRGGHVRNVPDVCENDQFYVRRKQFLEPLNWCYRMAKPRLNEFRVELLQFQVSAFRQQALCQVYKQLWVLHGTATVSSISFPTAGSLPSLQTAMSPAWNCYSFKYQLSVSRLFAKSTNSYESCMELLQFQVSASFSSAGSLSSLQTAMSPAWNCYSFKYQLANRQQALYNCQIYKQLWVWHGITTV